MIKLLSKTVSNKPLGPKRASQVRNRVQQTGNFGISKVFESGSVGKTHPNGINRLQVVICLLGQDF
jgi:hypothetical protein